MRRNHKIVLSRKIYQLYPKMHASPPPSPSELRLKGMRGYGKM